MFAMAHMHAGNLAAVDLNLLVALDAILAERSVTRAAARLGLTQPAMSHALRRLRDLFGDELLVRTRTGMVPTARGEALEQPLRATLRDLDALIHQGEAGFDPRTAAATFTIATTDYGAFVLLPALLPVLEREAPRIDLRLVSVPDPMADALADGRVDFVIATRPPDAAVLHKQPLCEERFVCVMRAGHPAGKKPLTLERYVSLSHALVAPRGRLGGAVDDALAARGLSRRVAVTIPNFLVAPAVIASSDLVVTLAERVARTFAKAFDLVITEPPVELSGFSMDFIWHERRHRDAAHVWMRRTVASALRARRR